MNCFHQKKNVPQKVPCNTSPITLPETNSSVLKIQWLEDYLFSCDGLFSSVMLVLDVLWSIWYLSGWVVSKIFTPIWGRFPFWLIFFRWVETTNQLYMFHKYVVAKLGFQSSPWTLDIHVFVAGTFTMKPKIWNGQLGSVGALMWCPR